MKDRTVCIDLAGGSSGGAGRFRQQYDNYAAAEALPSVLAIGHTRRLTAAWAAIREYRARGAHRAISTNNLGFAISGAEKWTMLRNANHFLSASEWHEFGSSFNRAFVLQIRLVRRFASRSDLLIVPSSSMAERVSTALPHLRDRLVTRFHPLEVIPRKSTSNNLPPTIVCPIVDSPFKHLGQRIAELQLALGHRTEVRVVCTTTRESMPDSVRGDDRFSFVGLLDRAKLQTIFQTASAVYYPTTIESFGYPLAEARAMGLPVIAQETAHNKEIAGAALCPYSLNDAGSLSAAIDQSIRRTVHPDPQPFSATTYFDWLLSS